MLITSGLRAWRPANVSSSELTACYRYTLIQTKLRLVVKSYSLCVLTNTTATHHLADTTKIADSVCPTCGTIDKSGEMSCCGRGGSWFRHCGSSGSRKRHHTWYDGIQACKARTQSRTSIGQQLNGAQQQKDIYLSQKANLANSKLFMAATKTFGFASVNVSTQMSETTSIPFMC